MKIKIENPVIDNIMTFVIVYIEKLFCIVHGKDFMYGDDKNANNK